MFKNIYSKKAEDIKKDLLKSYHYSFDSIKSKHYRRLKKNKALIGCLLAEERSNTIDLLIHRLLHLNGYDNLENISIVALGGYGRYELSPFSDIDVLVLYKKNNKRYAREITECLLYFLWDLGLDIGHSVRTIDECVELSYRKDDTTILTSLLDSRLICGDEIQYANLENEIYSQVLPRMSSDFIDRKLEEKENRMGRYGKTVYLLEPNVKEGEGGLRDLHTAIWIAQARYKVKSLDEILHKGFITEKEYRVITKCVSFLLLVRSELHYKAKRREDNLTYENQEKVAKFFGYKDSDLKAVEKFMRVYYLRANLVRQQSNAIIEKCLRKNIRRTSKKTVHLDHGFTIQGGYLSVTTRNIFKEDPVNIVRAFEYADKFNLDKSRYLLSLLRESVVLIDEKVRRDRDFNSTFLRLLRTGNNVSKILFEMNDLRILGHYIPEFGRIVCMVQYDAYHVYTVDIHSIFMVEEIERLINYEYDDEFSVQTKIAESLLKRDILYLACLFHDMGKGSGRNHSQKGAAMIPKISERMGLGKTESEQLEFLVRHHLVMTHFSQRRDIHDPTLITRFARSVRSLETLSLLYLLTFADTRSVGPDVWTNWKGMLLFELYLKTARLLEVGKYKKETLEERKERVDAEVIKLLAGQIKEKKVRSIMKKMPDSYYHGFSPKTMSQHVQIITDAGKTISTDIKFFPSHQYDEFTIWAHNKSGIFSQLCGVMSANKLNIMGARIVTTNDDRILDVLYVNKLGNSTEKEKQIWDKVEDDIKNAFRGKLDIDDILEKRKNSLSKYRKEVPKYPSKIIFDNESSDDSTIIDVYTYDREGLLYDITKTLHKLRLSIKYAKISTKVDQVVDAFYVVNIRNNKIKDKNRIKQIKEALLNAIN